MLDDQILKKSNRAKPDEQKKYKHKQIKSNYLYTYIVSVQKQNIFKHVKTTNSYVQNTFD